MTMVFLKFALALHNEIAGLVVHTEYTTEFGRLTTKKHSYVK
jgi:hypothetical protein